MTATTILGHDLAVGDLLLFLGATHRIQRFEAYRHPSFPDAPARIAVCEQDWRITAFDDARLEVAR